VSELAGEVVESTEELRVYVTAECLEMARKVMDIGREAVQKGDKTGALRCLDLMEFLINMVQECSL